jgi:hypothetical protein
MDARVRAMRVRVPAPREHAHGRGGAQHGWAAECTRSRIALRWAHAKRAVFRAERGAVYLRSGRRGGA